MNDLEPVLGRTGKPSLEVIHTSTFFVSLSHGREALLCSACTARVDEDFRGAKSKQKVLL